MMAVGVAAVPVTLEGDQETFELKLRFPGTIRGCGFWYRKPAVIGAASMRAVEYVPQPLLLVECDPEGELQVRRFAFLASDRVLKMPDGLDAQWRASAVGQHGAGHLFEIVQVDK